MSTNPSSGSHHVAWADRLDYNKILHNDIEACSQTYSTEEYHDMVWRFYDDMLNIKDGPPLREMTNTYIKNNWRPAIQKELLEWINEHQFDAHDPQMIQIEREKIEREHMNELCYFMKQLLEDNGFGFYKSSIEMENKMM